MTANNTKFSNTEDMASVPTSISPSLNVNLNSLPESDGVKTVFDPAYELANSWIDPTVEVTRPPTILEIGGVPTFTAGNISTIIGKAKSRKTFFLVGTLSAIASGSWGDLEGVRRKKVLWFDTEMSHYHASLMVKRCFRLMEEPGEIAAYGLRKYSPAERLQIIEYAIYNTENLGFVAIDGLRDLLSRGINDEEEATTITSKFLKWTAERDIHITLVLHQNKNDNNARGHIGTEAINKSETVLSATRSTQDHDITIVEAQQTRNLEFEPFAFVINDTGLPEFADIPEDKKGKTSINKGNPGVNDDDIHFEIINKVFASNTEYPYKELAEMMKEIIPSGMNSAKGFIKYYVDQNWIYKHAKTQKYYNGLS